MRIPRKFPKNGNKGKDKWEPGSSAWNRVDFSYGSDPEFKKHKDPRNKKKQRLQ